MRNFRRLVCCVGVLLALSTVAAAPTSPTTAPMSPAGAWNGAISIGPQSIPIALEFVPPAEPGGTWTGTFDQVQQGIRGLSLEKINLEGTKLTFAIRGVPGSPMFFGELNGDVIKGTFVQGGARGTFELKRGKYEPKRKPQEPTEPFPYKSEEVSVEVKPGVTLSGTLTLPEGSGPFVGVVLVSGSGPQDRDESLMGHKPFLVLSDRLTRAGIAVLRYDDRGVGRSTGNFGEGTTQDFADDAAAAAEWLSRHPTIRKDAVGIAGHSEGGLIAPMVAVRPGSPAKFIIMLAGPGVSGAEILKLQFKKTSLAAGLPPELTAQMAEHQSRMLDHLLAGKKEDAITELIELQILQRRLGNVTDEGKAMMRREVMPQMDRMTSPWFSHFLRHDPQETLRRVRVPVLVLNGELDTQVDPDQNVPVIEAAFKAGGNSDVTVQRLPKLNHLLQTAKTGSPTEYGQIEETMSETVPAVIASWIREHFTK